MATTAELRPSLSPRALATPTPIATSPHKVIKSLDGVRGLAILVVLFGHYDEFIRGGVGNNPLSGVIRFFLVAGSAGMGVYLFFVLSSFLLFLPYARALLSAQMTWPHTLTFYQRRIRRIVPAYLLLFITIACFTLIKFTRYYPLAQFPWIRFVPGLFLFYDLHPSAFSMLAGINPYVGAIDPPLWSLTVEWQFYLVLPLIAWGLSRLKSPRRIVVALLLLIVYGLVVRSIIVWLHYFGGVPVPAYTPGFVGLTCSLLFGINGKFLEVFALGMLVCLFYVWGIEQGNCTPKQQYILAGVALPVSLLSLTFEGLWWTFYVGPASWEAVSSSSLLGMGSIAFGTVLYGICGAALVLAVLCLPYSLGKIFSSWPLTFAGLISYSLYLWHWPLATFDVDAGVPIPPIIMLFLVLAWSVLLYYVVERPFLRYRHSK